MSMDTVPELEASRSHSVRHWRQNHPAFKDDKYPLGERAADKMRHGMGSWPFVFSFLGFMLFWTILNTVVLARHHGGFDPYPYVLLNLFLSMIAGLQGAILLISAKRSDQVSGQLAMHTDLQATKAAEIDTKTLDLVQAIHDVVVKGA